MVDRPFLPAVNVLSSLLKHQYLVIADCTPIGQDAIGCHLQQP
ncbi:MAG TPA: hypothetical protein V6D34_17375 [Candidatus Sericytochromatia bacterium]